MSRFYSLLSIVGDFTKRFDIFLLLTLTCSIRVFDAPKGENETVVSKLIIVEVVRRVPTWKIRVISDHALPMKLAIPA
jgi:hypothetical protein